MNTSVSSPGDVPDPAGGDNGAPTPARYPRLGLVASASLRHGPTSPLARLVRELTPYLMEHPPDIFAVEGSYRTILACGLLRGYPPERLHCLPPGRLGGLVDLGAAAVGESKAVSAAMRGLEPTVAER